MKIEKKFKTTSVIVMVMACIALLERIIGLIEQNRVIEKMNEVGWAVDISPDSLQRDARVILALIFGSITLWSGRAVKVALLSYGILYLIVETLVWSVGYRGTFDRINLEDHLLIGSFLIISIFIYWKQICFISGISLFATVYILLEYFFWGLLTLKTYEFSGASMPNSFLDLNGLFLGGQFWHLVIFLFASFLLIWQVHLLLQTRKSKL